ncbi:MAG: AarF/UbiB family protein, partial [Megasphaera elsdenii]|nr:AarF/UbiB family protein [Megasphaera elsdenii]
MTKFISWNVNGLRAVMKKGFLDIFQALDADVFCLQETKLQAGQIDLDLPGYEQYWNYADRKGYSGTAIFTRLAPLSVRYGMGIDEHDKLVEAGYDLAEIGAKLADNYVRQIMEDGFFHADPHPGNIRIRDGKIVWLDMGMMGSLNEKERKLIGNAIVG